MTLFWRRILLMFAALAVGALVADAIGHAYYRITRGVFLWRDDGAFNVFRVRPFTTFVDDERVVTLKKNITWNDFVIDANGFRAGSGSYEGKARNVVFIGDSVPFGWDVPGDRTVPAHFARLLETNGKDATGVINAAVPSYSLHQAVKRYLAEIDGRFAVSAVVLQTWDPANQLSRHGMAWNRRMNWSTANSELTPSEYLLIQRTRALQYSSLVYYAFQAYYRLNVKGPHLSPDDAETKARFEEENSLSLHELGTELAKRDVALYLLSANPAIGLRAEEHPVLVAVKWLNESLDSFSKASKRTHFVDLVQRFDEVGRQGLFIDDYHLTDAGAALEARTLYEEMSRNGDLP